MAVIEITTFRLTEGTDEGAFLAADEEMRTGFLYHQPGIARATTARDGEGGWAVIVLWYDDAHADAAAAKAPGLDGLIDESTIERRRYTTLD
jgi:hypothetical protein